MCAIASSVAFPLPPVIAALVLAPGADREVDESGGRLTGRGLVTGATATRSAYGRARGTRTPPLSPQRAGAPTAFDPPQRYR